MKIGNLLDTEFKTLVIRMLKELSEDFNRIKKIQSETKDTLIEITKTVEEQFTGKHNRVNEAENQISDLELRK